MYIDIVETNWLGMPADGCLRPLSQEINPRCVTQYSTVGKHILGRPRRLKLSASLDNMYYTEDDCEAFATTGPSPPSLS